MKHYTSLTDRTWLEVDPRRLVANYQAIRDFTEKKVIATIKSNAYGLGAVDVARILSQEGCDAFSVACLDEAIELRENGIQGTILILGYTSPRYAALLNNYSLTQTILNYEYAKALNEEARQNKSCIDVHILFDTGMSRIGILAQGPTYYRSAVDQACKICSMPHLQVKGLYTHFAVADSLDSSYTEWQLDSYKQISSEIIIQTRRPFLHHVAASGGILYHPESYRDFDAVRPGAILYGASPRNRPFEHENELEKKLQDTFSFRSRVVMLKDVPTGTKVSYGLLYTAERNIKIATLPAGYADGYLRSFTGKPMYAVINGKACPQIGKVCMDMTMYDVTAADVSEGDIAVIFGYGGMPINEMGLRSGLTIMSIPSVMPNRVPRVYCNNKSPESEKTEKTFLRN